VTTRERLHQLVDGLEPEAAERLIARWDEVRFMAGEWEPDDRPPTESEQLALHEAREDLAAARTVSPEALQARHPGSGRGE
jgi:hypothetical protein